MREFGSNEWKGHSHGTARHKSHHEQEKGGSASYWVVSRKLTFSCVACVPVCKLCGCVEEKKEFSFSLLTLLQSTLFPSSGITPFGYRMPFSVFRSSEQDPAGGLSGDHLKPSSHSLPLWCHAVSKHCIFFIIITSPLSYLISSALSTSHVKPTSLSYCMIVLLV